MTHLTPAQWRKRVERKIGTVLDAVWEEVVECEDDFISAANGEEQDNPGAGLGYLEERIEFEKKKYIRYQTAGPRLPERRLPERRELPQAGCQSPDTQTTALSRVIAALLNRAKDIQWFRQCFLPAGLLAPGAVLPWIKKFAEAESVNQEVSIKFSTGIGFGRAFVRDAFIKEAKLAAGDDWQTPTGALRWAFSFRWHYLEFLTPVPAGEVGHPWQSEGVQIGTDGVLYQLKKLASRYQHFWPEAHAVHFILTGLHHPIGKANAGYTNGEDFFPHILLRLHPSLSGDEVRDLYLTTRQLMKDWPGVSSAKGLTEKHLALAVFSAEQLGSWATLLRKWNKSYPQWGYPSAARATFARDCRAAYERVTGWKWRGEKTGKESGELHGYRESDLADLTHF